MNKYEVIGRVGKDPEIRVTQNSKVASFSIATSEYGGKDKEKVTEWHNVVIWGKLADVVEKYVKKGDLLFVSGSHRTRSWEKDGVTRYASELVARDLEMLGGNKDQPKGVKEPEFTGGNNEEASDTLPF